jgi:hypothetical protein
MPKKLFAKTRITIHYHDENMNPINTDLPYDDIYTNFAHSEFLKYLDENPDNLYSTLKMFCIEKGINCNELLDHDLLNVISFKYLNIMHSNNVSNIIEYPISITVHKDKITMNKIFTHKYFNDQIFKVINTNTLPELLDEAKSIKIENDMINRMFDNI